MSDALNASTVLDSLLYRDAFGTPAMRAVFSDQRFLERCVEVEIALAQAQAGCGVIPGHAAREIAALARADKLDLAKLKAETDNVGYPILPLVHQLVTQCGDSGRYVHWGATTQDIMDTALVLQLREAFAAIDEDLRSLRRILRALATQHRATVMAGRTHLQQALPITFGYKACVWLSMLDRHQTRLAQLLPRLMVGQFAGAVGTLASLGSEGMRVQQALMERLDLAAPVCTWHVARDNLAEALNLLGLISASLAKIALDVILLASTEVGEVSEPFVPGRGASSTMPQKRNPISSELILAAARGVRQHAGLMLDAMVQDLERATGPWHAEWLAVSQGFVLTAGALQQARFLLRGLEVRPERMRTNLDASRGLIMAEAVMMGLAPHLGRQQAHDVVYEACRRVHDGASTLAEQLAAGPQLKEQLSAAQIAALGDPANYLGSTQAIIDRTIAASEAIDRDR